MQQKSNGAHLKRIHSDIVVHFDDVGWDGVVGPTPATSKTGYDIQRLYLYAVMDSAPSASCGISKMQVDVWTLDPCLLVASHHRCISLVSIQDLSHSKSSATEPCLTTLFNFHFQLDTLREKDFDGFQMCIWNLECNACYMTLQHAAMCECSPHILGLSPWIVR